MPYIVHDLRDIVDYPINELILRISARPESERPGMFNYVVSRLLLGLATHATYRLYALLIGGLECAKFEFYRRRVAPYEDAARAVNGDI